MSNLNFILEKIVSDAEEKAKEIKREAENKGVQLITKYENEAKDKTKRKLQRAKSETTQTMERIVSQAKIKARDEQLKAKGEIIDQVLKKAEVYLITLPEDQYVAFVKGALKNLSINQNKKLVVPKGRKKSLVPFYKEIEIIESKEIHSGFQLIDERMIHNYTFSSIIKFYKEELRALIANYLFKEKEG